MTAQVHIRYQQVRKGDDGPEIVWATIALPLDGCIHNQSYGLGWMPEGEFQFVATVQHAMPEPPTAESIAQALVAELADRLRGPDYPNG